MAVSNSLVRNLVPRSAAARRGLTAGELLAAGNRDTFFIGYPSWPFRFWAPAIFGALGERVAGVVSDRFVNDYSHMTLRGSPCPLVSMEAFLEIAQSRIVRLVHFFKHREQYWGLERVAHLPNVTVVDYLTELDVLGLAHTYIPVKEEREWWAGQSMAVRSRVAERFGDERSRRTFSARLSAIETGIRRPLLDVAVLGDYQYFNTVDPHFSFVLRPDEVYVDVGAADGDTLVKFRDSCQNAFKRIEAFEPTLLQFGRLQQRAGADPRIQLHNVAVGSTSGSVKFFENEANPFGSNALTVSNNPSVREVPCVQLDEVVDACTLIKMDVEGFETEVIKGARRLVASSKPDMTITCYHYPQDLIEILDTVEAIHAYKFVALRHFGPSLYDSILFFSDRQSFE